MATKKDVRHGDRRREMKQGQGQKERDGKTGTWIIVHPAVIAPLRRPDKPDQFGQGSRCVVVVGVFSL